MSHIFISYSRRDLELAQKIVNALGQGGVETWVDWKSIPKGEDWEQEIYRGIEAADAFLFLISPDSVQSRMCNKEVLHAIQNHKRILPILIREAETTAFLEPVARDEIRRLNWLHCRPDRDDFAGAMQSAQETIQTDYEWLRFHTFLQMEALTWQRAGHDESRLLRGKALKDAEARIARTGTRTEPFLTDLQRQFMTLSRRTVRQRQALPYSLILALGAAIFLGGKFFYYVLPIARACPEIGRVSVQLEASGLPDALHQTLNSAMDRSVSQTTLRACASAPEAVLEASAGYEPGTKHVNLSVRLPETPAYRLDFFQEIRQLGPELLAESEALALLQASAAYAVGEYRTAIDLLEGYESLSALTLLAQARLFGDDLAGSRAAYHLALQKPQPDPDYTGRLNMGAALAWWRPQSYYLLSFQGDTQDCKQAGTYYARAQDWIQSNKLAQNIRIAYARFCVDPNDPAYAEYAAWRDQTPQSETDLSGTEASQINAVEQYILALNQDVNEGASRPIYLEHLRAAQPLLLARAALSEFYWGDQEDCREARSWRQAFQSGMVSDIERRKLRKLLQEQPLFCR